MTHRLILAAGLLLSACGGCVSSMRAGAGGAVLPASANAELLEYIGDQAYLTAEPAYRAIYVLRHGQPFEGAFDALASTLASEGLIGGGWGLSSDSYIDRAAVGFMVCRACDLRGGVNWPLTGLGRYAWRELQYRRIAGAGGDTSPISGGEFLGILSRAEEYAAASGRPMGGQRATLGGEPTGR